MCKKKSILVFPNFSTRIKGAKKSTLELKWKGKLRELSFRWLRFLMRSWSTPDDEYFLVENDKVLRGESEILHVISFAYIRSN